MPTTRFQRKYIPILFGFLLIGSLALNLWGIGYGLPEKYYPDEGRLVNHALAFGLGDFNPHYFHYPALGMYILFLLYGGYFAIGHLLGIFTSITDFQYLFFSDPSSFYIIGRVWVAITATATVAATYLVGKSAFGDKRTGLLGGLFLATLPYYVYYSHFVITDLLLLFFILLAYVFIFRIYRQGRIGDYLAAGALAGLGMATKYSPGLLIFPILLAHFFYIHDQRKKMLSRASCWPIALTVLIMLLFFFIGSPYCFLDYKNFYASTQFRALLGREHTFGTGAGTAWLIYPRLLFSHPFLTVNQIDLMGIVFIGGILWALIRHRQEDYILLAFPLALYLVMGRWTSGSNRYSLPLVVIFSIWSGRAAVDIFARLRRARVPKASQRWGLTLLGGFLALAVSLSLLNVIFMNFQLSQKDTRSLAKEWVEKHIPAKAKIVLEWDSEATVQLWETPKDIQAKITGYEAGGKRTIHHSSEQMAAIHRMRLEAAPEMNYTLIRIGGVDGVRVKPTLYSLGELRARGMEYLITSSEVSNIFKSPQALKIYPRQVKFYQDLDRELSLIKEFRPRPLFNLGPVVRIYQF